MKYKLEELLKAEFQLQSLLYKLKQTLKTLKSKENNKHKSQITLTSRRIKAFEISIELLYLISNP
ncbi:MAG: hypothetical protein J6K87_01175 [Clostridia bacterium]|nr:hypothetical protein [Clostridia bacterium]